MGSESLLLGQGQACTQSSSSFLSFLPLSITSPSTLFFLHIPLSVSSVLLLTSKDTHEQRSALWEPPLDLGD